MPKFAEPDAAVEQVDCSTCEVPAGSTCRTRGGKVAPKYHTPRFMNAATGRATRSAPGRLTAANTMS
ncbi:zinc finger domain-containing protein [Streptomyces sp. Go40/10]|uniref:zinc finger domain-containing protein n=1 Tax=Streptomyces sp. Go40/10 TaxID=2825844 RepID=UPI003FA68664